MEKESKAAPNHKKQKVGPRRSNGGDEPKEMSDLMKELPWVPPFDPRFPNTNQTRNCYQNYLDYHRCMKVKKARAESEEPCEFFRRAYKSLCPRAWTERWDTQIKEKRFAGKI